MRRLRAAFLRVAGLFGRDRRERELAEELESHLALHVQDGLRAGLDAAEARRQAHLRLGSLDSVKEACRDRRGVPLVETALLDLRYAARTLRRNGAFTAVAVVTLAVGIGATTTMFSVAEAVLLRPLPYPEPHRLVQVTETNPLKNWTHVEAAPANFADWRASNTVFRDMAGYVDNNVFLTGQGEPERLHALFSTGNLFAVLGVSPRLGRAFTDDETFEGKERVAILSHGLWQSRFAGEPNVVGRTISLDARSYTVVGVMAPDFFFPTREVEIWLPLGLRPAAFTEQRRPHYLGVVARLRPSVSLEQASDAMTAIAAGLERTYPDTNTKMGVRLDGFHATLAREKRPALLMLLGAVAVLFLAVCSNVANLQLGRAAARGREFGIRHALGAGRRQLARQVLTESLCLSLLGGGLGIAVAAAARLALLRLAPAAIPPFAELRLDLPVVLFAAVVTFLTPLLFGLAPALTAGSTGFLQDRSATNPVAGRRVRDLFVAGQAALSVVLVVGAALLVRSLIQLESVHPGFAADGAISFSVQLPGVRYPTEESAARTFLDLEQALREQPNVQVVGASRKLPLKGYGYTGDATPEGRAGDDYERELRHNSVTPDYFRAVGTPLLGGRFFTAADTARSSPVTIVNETLEKAYFRGEPALGRRIKFGRPQDGDPWVTIVGVVADQRQDGLDRRVQPEAYVPLPQDVSYAMQFVVRGGGGPEALSAAGRLALRGVDRELALSDVAPLDDLVRASVGDQRFRTALLAGFAAIALFLAALGVYGVLAYSVARRTREIGVRMALGAPRQKLVAMVMRDGLRPVILGTAVGLPAAYAGASLIRSLLFGVAPADPVTYAVTVAVLGAAAALACVEPARRALQVDPGVCLRDQ